MLETLGTILRPLVRLLLRNGVGYAEFSSVAKSVFVQVATDDYGLRGRPTNMSRISAMTGISRKEIRRFRSQGAEARWTPGMEGSPINTILHFWHYDPEFCEKPGNPKALVFDGPGGFVSLVAKYAGDIPAGAIRSSLIHAGSVEQTAEGRLVATESYYIPTKTTHDFIRGLGFSLANLGGTLFHNATIRNAKRRPGDARDTPTRFERAAWTEHLDERSAMRFREWVDINGARFVTEANAWIGRNELPKRSWSRSRHRATGVGIYYFEDD
jgi:hypothetical protein